MAISLAKRFRVFRRDNYTCTYCGRRPPEVELEIDHHHPRSQGGSDDESNLVTACWECNRGKGGKSAVEPISPEEDALLDFIFMGDGMECPDTLPAWFAGPRGKYHVNLNFDIHAAAAELPSPKDWDAVYATAVVPETLEDLNG